MHSSDYDLTLIDRGYIREAEAEINRLSWEVKATRIRTQRAMVAALYWRAGVYAVLCDDSPRAAEEYRVMQAAAYCAARDVADAVQRAETRRAS